MERLKEFNEMIAQISKENPEKFAAFYNFLQKVEGEGALSVKTKELIALAIGVAKHCEWCISYHINEALKAGATREEILEAAWVAVLMDGGPGLSHFVPVLKALKELQGK
ncbi:MAG TPA: carboxymuconolactone decarboxylase family protein [Fervidicoccus fontis]|jgi:AhpD family alkylhydroperoxidase|uniref:Carboxymuconolactone decarboxylase family protein n=1 Tax=Fervidicoccus fontis TaxID=683846 RepID=A0A7C2ULJ5_9CREN|nr:MAG: carboxymuconolactone decarboxylase family protein [Fervidicoccus sp.]HEU97929.1 carboxymuconolactone decarboxylase family protein [Fervidicoccus fontis]